MSEKKTQDALLEAIDIMIENKLKKLKFNYYVDGVIASVNNKNNNNQTYNVIINGQTYTSIPSKNNFRYSKGDSVQILIKNGDWNKKFIDDKITHNMVKQADYVVERGINGIWTYTKWASGRAECWGVSNVTVDATTAWGTALFYGSASQIALPFKFAEAPLCQITSEQGTSSQSVFVMSHGKATQTTTPACTVARATSSSNVNCNLLYRVIGKWK